ncbi:NUDIX domain-containing protein [Halococcus sp. AFM35]|uniref:NUDIX domain-containing protein n=1 Tax=Halococcus sp. AFM35 TaxID=3421653 RepID=UPI003EB978CA
MSDGDSVDQSTYCPTCGTDLVDQQLEGRTRRYCPNCEQPIYRNPKPCAGVLVVDKRDQVLLVQRTQPPAVGAWSLPAGYLEADEPPAMAAVRELSEETALSLAIEDLQLHDTTFVRHPGRHHVLVVIYTASRSQTTGSVEADSDAAAARFWGLAEFRASGERIEPGYGAILETAIQSARTDGEE